jgi:monovalent cation:H+ antiporter-2, CPA2 family
MDHIFIIGGVLFLLFFVVSYLFQKVRLPSLLSYIFLGVALSRLFTGPELRVLDEISRTGIVLLFFLLGLHFPLNRLIGISRRIWQAGVMDIVLNFGVSAVIAYLFGLGLIQALIIGGVAYASSSAMTIRLLEESGRMNSPEGEFKLALLIFEDLAAPVIVSVLVGLSATGIITGSALAVTFGKVILLSAAAILIAYYLFRRVDLFIQRYIQKDFMPLFAVSIAFIFAGIAEYMDLSKLLGAFLAGVMLSETGTSREFDRMIEPVKNLFMPFFFFWFGTSIDLGAGRFDIVALVVLILWGLFAKMIVGLWGGRIYGLTVKGSIRAAFSLGQRGEFSVVIAALALTGLRFFLGLYIAVTAVVGVYLFRLAPSIGEKIGDWWIRRKEEKTEKTEKS